MAALLKRVLEEMVKGIFTGLLLFERGTYPTKAINILRTRGKLIDGPIATGSLLFFQMAVHTIRKTKPILKYTRIDCYAMFGSGAVDCNGRSFLIIKVTDDSKTFQTIKECR